MSDRKKAKRFRYLDWALDQSTGSLSANLMLIIMARRGNASGLCWMSQSRIALEAGCGLSTVQRAISHLLANGYIEDVSKNYPARITKTYNFRSDRINSGQSDGVSYSNRRLPTVQIDAQNPYKSQIKPASTKCRPVDNMFKREAEQDDSINGRRKRATQIGDLISGSVNRA